MTDIKYILSITDMIQATASQCAAKGSHFDALWHELLDKILSHWGAKIEIDLWDATKILLESAGYYFDTDWRDTHPCSNYDFWYKYKNDISALQILNRQYIVFRMTVAVFETINYWCWHNAPLQITFNKDNLCNVLKNGNIAIDWAAYKFDYQYFLRFYTK